MRACGPFARGSSGIAGKTPFDGLLQDSYEPQILESAKRQPVSPPLDPPPPRPVKEGNRLPKAVIRQLSYPLSSGPVRGKTHSLASPLHLIDTANLRP
jgi:hypothetical protein